MQKGFTPIIIILGIVLILGITGGMYYFGKSSVNPADNNSRACTQEAKICPDGSSVGRTGPNCEFSSCPSPLPKPTLDLTSCTTVRDCGLNTCGCIAQRKELLDKNMCAQACPGELKCLNNKCVLDRSKLSQ